MDVLMALCDFIPVGLFLAAAIIFQRDLYNKMSKGSFALFSTGTITVFCAGTLKALYKFLGYAFDVNWDTLNKCFFPMQTLGFVIAAAGMIALMVHKQGKGKAYSISLPIMLGAIIMSADFQNNKEYKGTMIFVVLMVLGVAIVDGCSIYIAIKKKSVAAVICLAIAFIGTLGMGYLSTKESLSDWYKELVNTIGQAGYLAGAIILRKNGLGDPNSLSGIAKEK